jgi:hypothetical protein
VTSRGSTASDRTSDIQAKLDFPRFGGLTGLGAHGTFSAPTREVGELASAFDRRWAFRSLKILAAALLTSACSEGGARMAQPGE